ncbi:hypothetical protein EST38_g4891 [Candolleomyces aberdarensis]|uniref:Uncharacterized protein n=1 Tax=Candolleomyces aberdarensis TaxID=2316362 RepID=A0A4Q2DLU0_9AGAR|nr:hypothetical protein EST38_g4891 [Candolleomyces aberdarensis]
MISAKHPAVVISHVCQRWRQIALDHPFLWTEFDVDIPVYPILPFLHNDTLSIETSAQFQTELAQWERKLASRRNFVELWITRSAQCSLSFSLRAFLRDLYRQQCPQGAIDILASFADLLCGASRRWKRVQLSLDIDTFKSPLLQLLHIDPMNFPRPEAARLSVNVRDIYSGGLTGGDVTSQIGILQAPSLRSVTLTDLWAPISRFPIKWSTITELSLGAYRIAEGIEGRIVTDTRHAIDIFSSCPNLIKCALTTGSEWEAGTLNDSLPHSLPLEQQIPLPFLTSMSIWGPLSQGLGTSLYLPSLRTLLLLGSSITHKNEDESAVVEWIQNFGVVLTEVTLEHPCLTQSALLYCLKRLPNVTTLRLVDRSATATLFNFLGEAPSFEPSVDGSHPAVVNELLLEKLTPKVNQDGLCLSDCLCPNLQRFGCRIEQIEFREEALLEFIAGRRRRGNLALLESVVVRFRGFPQQMDIRSELEKRSVCLEDFVLVVGYCVNSYTFIPPSTKSSGERSYNLSLLDRYLTEFIFPSCAL